MEIVSYSVRKITAERTHSNGSHWVDVTIHERCEYTRNVKESKITLFFAGANARLLADEYAAAINGVDAEQPDPDAPHPAVSALKLPKEEIAF